MTKIEFIIESSESSAAENWPLIGLRASGLTVPDFEGYSLRGGAVTCLLDRARVDSGDDFLRDGLCEAYAETFPANEKAKAAFSLAVNAQRALVFYRETTTGFDFRVATAQPGGKFGAASPPMSASEFIGWTAKNRDMRMAKPFGENNNASLPPVDMHLRKVGLAWPGNLDGFLIGHDGQPAAVLEFSMTQRSAERHSHNRYFDDDRARWAAFGMATKAAKAPGVIVVWNADEARAKIKVLADVVPHAVELTNAAGEKRMMMPGLHYSGVEMMDAKEMAALMSGIAATGKIPSRLLGEPSMDENPRTIFQADEEHAAADRTPEPAKQATFRSFRPPRAAPEPAQAEEAAPDAEKAEAKTAARRTVMRCPPFCSWALGEPMAAKQ